MTQKEYAPHIFSLCALSVLGNALISMPFYKNAGFFSLLISAIISLLLIILISAILKYEKNNKFIAFGVKFIVCATAIYGAAVTFFDYVRFLKSVQMPQTNVILLAVVLFGIVAFLLLCSFSAIFKYCLFVSVIAAVLIIICFVGGIRSFDFSMLKSDFLKFNFSLKDFLWCFSSLAVIPFFISLKLKSTPTKPMFLGTMAGFLILLLCLAQINLTLGATPDISYPYQKAVSVISTGSLFSRLDGFVYFLFFITAIVKIAICAKTFYCLVTIDKKF